MSYSGSTAASSVANPPSRVATGLLSQRNIRESTSVAEGGSLWTYVSSNLTTDIVSSGFFTDAGNLGMRNGDIMIAGQYSTEGSSSYVVSKPDQGRGNSPLFLTRREQWQKKR
jgi:hypothetical protein